MCKYLTMTSLRARTHTRATYERNKKKKKTPIKIKVRDIVRLIVKKKIFFFRKKKPIKFTNKFYYGLSGSTSYFSFWFLFY